MDKRVELVAVADADRAAEFGFFCYKSKPKTEGYRRKLAWLERRFAEGLQIRIVREDDRSVGFIEYTPAEFAWRPVEAEGYLLIHCLWVVGRAKEKGYGSRLLDTCIADARATGRRGVAAVTRQGRHLVGRGIFLKRGFEVVDQAPPGFDLVAMTFDDTPAPAFPGDWEERQARYGQGLTVVYADQCPYFSHTVQQTLETAGEVGIEAQTVALQTAREVQERAPCPYGTLGIVYEGALLSCTPLSERKLIAGLRETLDKTGG
jgi:GNAT superfamily N-acetyltransferase